VVGLSPDSVDVLQAFSKQKEIEFPLLSDTDGTAIKALGLQNKASKKFLPHPGILLIGQDGVVHGKLFKEGHKARHENAVILKSVSKLSKQLKSPQPAVAQ
jgi:peroxiredoxin